MARDAKTLLAEECTVSEIKECSFTHIEEPTLHQMKGPSIIWEIPKIWGTLCWVLIMRILLFRVLY